MLKISGKADTKYARIVKRLTPSQSAYNDYLGGANYYKSLVGPGLSSSSEVLRSLHFRKSTIFGGRKYLVACVDDQWFLKIAGPGTDAIASPNDDDEEGFSVICPPLAMIPESKKMSRSREFRSIVDHEIVHVNQMILGAYPKTPPEDRTTKALQELFVDFTVCEHDANFLQAVAWGIDRYTEYGMSLDHYSFLRGHTQALERVLYTAMTLDFSAEVIQQFLEELITLVPEGLRRTYIDEPLEPWFRDFYNRNVSVTLEALSESYPDIMNRKAWKPVVGWFENRLRSATA